MTSDEVLEQLTEYDIIDIMIDLGSSNPSRCNDGLLFSTICHNHDGTGKKKLHYHSQDKCFYCYTHCHMIGNLYKVVMKVRECSWREAYNYVCTFFRIPVTFLQYGFTSAKVDNSFIRKFETHEEKHKELEIKESSVLKTFWPNLFHKSWIDDFITIDAMKKFNVQFDISKNRIIIPHYDKDNNLVGIRCRNFNQAEVDDGKKYMPISVNNVIYKYDTHLNLYGLNISKNAIKKYRKAIIGESEKFVMQLYSFYNENSVAVAVSGSSLSNEQMKLLIDLDVEEVVVALDKEFTNEEEEKAYKEKVNKSFVNKLNPYFKVSVIWDTNNLLENKMSPTDKGRETFEKLLKSRIFI